jgi:hypothetical protein
MSPTTPSDRLSRRDSAAHPPKEEPDFVNERDLPTADAPRRDRPPKDPAPRKADVAGVESAAGEEDPGAALDTPPTTSPGSPA